MRYIEEIKLINFQSHKNTKLVLDPKLNVIVGPSDSGKTSIIRGLKWLFYNGLRGTEFIKEGETNSSVSIKYNDGYEIIRKRNTSNENSYTIIYPDGKEDKFDSVGTKVPLEVIEITGVEEVDLSGMKGYINLSEQLEGPFLLNESPNTKSKVLGDLIGINIIEDAMTNLRRDRLNINREIDYLNKEKESREEEAEKYSYLENLFKRLKQTEININNLDKKIEKLNKLNNLSKRYKDNIKIVNKINQHLKTMPDIENLESILENLEIKYNNQKFLENIFYKLINLSENITQNKIILTNYGSLDLLIENVDNIENRSKKLNWLEIKFNKYNQLNKDISNCKNILDILKNIEIADDNINTLREYSMKYDRFINFNKNLITLNKNIDNYKEFLNSQNNLLKTEKFIEDIDSYNKILKNLKLYKEKIKTNDKNIESLKYEIEKIDKEYKNYLNDYKDILLNLKVCPYCHSDLDNQHINELIKEL